MERLKLSQLVPTYWVLQDYVTTLAESVSSMVTLDHRLPISLSVLLLVNQTVLV